jgi:hypothetical protein
MFVVFREALKKLKKLAQNQIIFLSKILTLPILGKMIFQFIIEPIKLTFLELKICD